MKKKLLVVGAHSADFVWRAAGIIAKALEEGADGRIDGPFGKCASRWEAPN